MQPSIQTFSGLRFNYLAPDPETILIEDIARALSHVTRYCGHTKKFYSVAEHSYNVASITSPPNRLAGLMHDATEAYVNDLPSPLKRLLPEYQVIEARVWSAICIKFGLNEKLPDEVKYNDIRVLNAERKYLLAETDWKWADEIEAIPSAQIMPLCLTPQVAEARFLKAFYALAGVRKAA